ncbi:unnamed protein product [Timema podura]|uniref:Uncharacterized protein n=1 Tax=Timema podura TaxID=61482 RepID=A0ABN7NL35_TIMPD|nr:unnamed protein product [Timema podura]
MSEETKPDNSSTNTSFKIKAGLFLASVAGAASIIGFGSTLAAAKKQDAVSFNKDSPCEERAYKLDDVTEPPLLANISLDGIEIIVNEGLGDKYWFPQLPCHVERSMKNVTEAFGKSQIPNILKDLRVPTLVNLLKMNENLLPIGHFVEVLCEPCEVGTSLLILFLCPD